MGIENYALLFCQSKGGVIISERTLEGVLINNNKEYFTRYGSKAYDKLTEILYTVGEITEMENEVNKIIKRLDDIVVQE